VYVPLTQQVGKRTHQRFGTHPTDNAHDQTIGRCAWEGERGKAAAVLSTKGVAGEITHCLKCEALASTILVWREISTPTGQERKRFARASEYAPHSCGCV